MKISKISHGSNTTAKIWAETMYEGSVLRIEWPKEIVERVLRKLSNDDFARGYKEGFDASQDIESGR
jgi:hypothetical protein